jgi:hypothetical protein
LYLALAIEDVLGVELGNTFDGLCIATRVKVDDFLVGVLEREDDGIGWEGGEGRMQFLQWVLELVGSLSHCAWRGALDACKLWHVYLRRGSAVHRDKLRQCCLQRARDRA